MCGRVAQRLASAELARLLEAEDRASTDGGRFNVAPAQPIAAAGILPPAVRTIAITRW